MSQITETPRDEQANVESWRLHVLMEAGFPLPLAEKIAERQDDLEKPSDTETSLEQQAQLIDALKQRGYAFGDIGILHRRFARQCGQPGLCRRRQTDNGQWLCWL